MEARLLEAVGVGAAHGAGAPRAAGALHAVGAGLGREVRGAGGDVVALGGQRPDRAGRETGLVGAALAGARAAVAGRQAEPFAEGQGAAISVPQSVVGMDQRADGRGVHRLGALRPALEW